MTGIRMGNDDDVVETIRLLMKSRRAHAHSRLLAWARNRERAGFPAFSIFGKIVDDHVQGNTERAHCDDVHLNLVESKAGRLGETLEIERYVRAMPQEWKMVIKAVYIHGASMDRAASSLSLERTRIINRLMDIKDRIACEVEAQRVSETFGYFDRLTQEPETEKKAHRGDSVAEKNSRRCKLQARPESKTAEPIKRYRKVNRDPLLTLPNKLKPA